VKLEAAAPAKINRELRVGGIRPDGFHEIRSRMISIDLADGLSAETAERLTFSCDDPAVPPGSENLVVRAAESLARWAGITAGVHLRLEKRVPIGGGLGGGSADGAVTLRLLARFWRIAIPAPELERLAAGLGSDVPFFLAGGQADVAGRGERVEPVEDSPPTELLLLVPPFSISTRAVYQVYGDRGRLAERLDVASPVAGRFLGPNDLAPAVLTMEPRMEAYLESAARMTSDWTISGSGATVVLHGAPPDGAARLAEWHPEARVFPCRTLSREQYGTRVGPVGGASS
jgi:4-diphosphocytidyl-2-C-methyl-D-erythritol kinase